MFSDLEDAEYSDCSNRSDSNGSDWEWNVGANTFSALQSNAFSVLIQCHPLMWPPVAPDVWSHIRGVSHQSNNVRPTARILMGKAPLQGSHSRETIALEGLHLLEASNSLETTLHSTWSTFHIPPFIPHCYSLYLERYFLTCINGGPSEGQLLSFTTDHCIYLASHIDWPIVNLEYPSWETTPSINQNFYTTNIPSIVRLSGTTAK